MSVASIPHPSSFKVDGADRQPEMNCPLCLDTIQAATAPSNAQVSNVPVAVVLFFCVLC